MTDIVERLRADPGPADLTELIRIMVEQRREAADEIERLRATLQQIADDATPGDDNYCSEIARRALEPKPKQERVRPLPSEPFKIG